MRRVVLQYHHRVVLDLVIIGLAITLEPITLVAFILLLAAKSGIWKGLAFILGWLACLVAVVAAVVLATGGNPPRQHTAPSTAVLVIKALLGILLIWIGIRRRRQAGPAAQAADLDGMAGPHVAMGGGRVRRLHAAVVAGGDRGRDGRAGQAVDRGRLAGAGDVLPARHVELSGHGAVRGPVRPRRPRSASGGYGHGSTRTRIRRSSSGRSRWAACCSPTAST